jgi:hypothetical protein
MSKLSKNIYKQHQNIPLWSKYHILSKEVIKKKHLTYLPSTNVTQFGNFSHICKERYNVRNYIQSPMLQFIIRKNAQLSYSDEYVTCLLCSKPGHLCHECIDYEPKIQQSNNDESFELPSPRINNTNDLNKYDLSQDKVMESQEITNTLVPIVLAKSPMNKLPSTTFTNKSESIDNNNSTYVFNIYCLKEPILFKKDPIFINKFIYKNYLNEFTSIDTQLRAKSIPHNQEALSNDDNQNAQCALGFNCDDSKHTINKFIEDCTSKYLGSNKSIQNCKVMQLCAQMSFRIRGRPPFNPILHSKLSECDYYDENKATPNVVHEIENISNNNREVLKNNIYHKLNYKIQEVDYEQLLNSKNKNLKSKDLKPIINLCEYEQSVAVVSGKINGHESMMLLDTGSSISAITEVFVQQLNLESWYTNDILVVTLANTRVEKYRERKCFVTLEIGDLKCCEEFDVLPGQIYNVTLGKNWLKEHMAICDYGLDILRLPNSRPIRMGFLPATRLKSAMKKKA